MSPAVRQSEGIRREAEMLAEATAELDAGQGLSGPALIAWLDTWERDDHATPAPPK